jgi:multiple sugar transport system ATP-binding protein
VVVSVSDAESVVVSVDPDAVHVFDGTTGDAIRNGRVETERELTQV